MSGERHETRSVAKPPFALQDDQQVVELDPPRELRPHETSVDFQHFETPVREKSYDSTSKRSVRADVARWSIVLVGLLMVLAAVCAVLGRSTDWVPQFVTAVGILCAGAVAFYYGETKRGVS